ncbi:hypothetical protein [Cellulomonas sp. KRMCY2]|uniref:hypothetical protein n=1 Tax=Cellulomonas sp. KRMCY2 TaxID=1304865 RepID=UPI00045E6B7B|nr:hypothetical protein [Cellulomonas sp. KRMCY2]
MERTFVPEGEPPAGAAGHLLSDDGRWWWDGLRWQPTAAPHPTPVPRPDLAPPPTMAPPDAHWAPRTPPTVAWAQSRRTGPTGRTVALVVGSILGAALLGLGAMAALGMRTVEVQQERVDDAVLRATLLSAMLAQETYRVDAFSYTTDLAELTSSGLTLGPGTEVTIVSASADAFCLAVGQHGVEPTMWATQEARDLEVPCS